MADEPDDGEETSAIAALDEYLTSVGALEDEDIDLAETALILAALDKPEVDLATYRSHLAVLVDDVKGGLPDSGVGVTSAADQVAAISGVLFDKHGYSGDSENYDDLANANLMDVIDRKRGLPVALAILFIHVGRAVGWDVAGLNFPGHFLLRLQVGGDRVVVDPFSQGQALGPAELRALAKKMGGDDAEVQPEHYRELTNREILIRLQNNIKVRAVQAEDLDHAVMIMNHMVSFAPEYPALWFETGMLNAQFGQFQVAKIALENCLQRTDDSSTRAQVQGLLDRVEMQIN